MKLHSIARRGAPSRRPGRLASVLVSAAIVGTSMITASPAIGAPAAAASTIDVTIGDSPIASRYSAKWSLDTSGQDFTIGNGFAVSTADTTALHVTLPVDVGQYDTGGVSWVLTGAGTRLAEGSIPGERPAAFDVDLEKGLNDGSHTFSLLIVALATSGHPDRVTLQVDLLAVPGLSSPEVAIDLSDREPDTASLSTTVTGSPAPLTVTDGARVAVHGPPGFWNHGPHNSWPAANHPAPLLRSADRTDFESAQPGEVSLDGSTLTFTLPDTTRTFIAAHPGSQILADIAEYPRDPRLAEQVTFSLPVTAAPPWTPAVNRVSGADRYEAAVNVSKASFPGDAPIAFIASGSAFADALSAGPAAAALGGPVLLTEAGRLPASVAEEIKRLQPDRIVVVGGPASVSEDVLDALKVQQDDTIRLGGSDRYEVSQNVARFTFGSSGSPTAYVATGSNFPDALSAGAAAAAGNAPVILVNGTAHTADESTRSVLADLGVERIVISGGPVSVSRDIEADLSRIATVVRHGGSDRYEVSAAIGAATFPSSSHAFLATGEKYPDALAATAWAGRTAAPLYVVPSGCIPKGTIAAMEAQGVVAVTLVGGPASLNSSVESLTHC